MTEDIPRDDKLFAPILKLDFSNLKYTELLVYEDNNSGIGEYRYVVQIRDNQAGYGYKEYSSLNIIEKEHITDILSIVGVSKDRTVNNFI